MTGVMTEYLLHREQTDPPVVLRFLSQHECALSEYDRCASAISPPGSHDLAPKSNAPQF